MSEINLPDMELRNAIHKIEEFSRRHGKLQKNPLHKTISLFRSLIFSGRRSFKDQTEVLKAIEIINRQRHRIQKLKLGTLAEQKLGDSYTKAIEEFNANLDGSKKLPKIELPNQTTVKKYFPAQSSEIINSLRQTLIPVNMTKQHAELFQMKVLALLERYGIASNPEARHAVKKSPIIPAMEEDPSTCTLSQTISLFPGQIVKIKGTSELDPQTQTICKLFPDTFSVSLESTQTGFPYPSQRTGWALAHQLLPECPHRPDLLGELAEFYQRKKAVVEELQPHGKLIDKAKKLLKLKREAFDQNRKEFLRLHKELAKALLNLETVVDNFFQSLESCPSPFDRLSEAYQYINEQFIARQHNQLIYAILHDPQLKAENPSQRMQAAEKILDMAHEPMEDEFIECMGKILGNSAKKILLQYFSEDLSYEPLPLNQFERTLQNIAFKHGEDFLNELQSDTLNDIDEMRDHLIKQMEWDIAQFNKQVETSIPDILETYFTQRYQVQIGNLAS